MSLIKCFECGTNVSEFAEKCPSCGCPIDVIKNPKKVENICIVNERKCDMSDILKSIQDNFKSKATITREIRELTGLDLKSGDHLRNIIEETNSIPKEFNGGVSTSYLREQNAPRCPICGSTNVRTEKMRFIGGIWFKNSKPFICSRCGYHWG